MAVLSCVLLFITMHISDCHQFSDIHISQGSVTTYLRSDAISRQNVVANLPARLPVKEFQKLLSIWGSYGQEFNVLFFIDSRCSRNQRDRKAFSYNITDVRDTQTHNL